MRNVSSAFQASFLVRQAPADGAGPVRRVDTGMTRISAFGKQMTLFYLCPVPTIVLTRTLDFARSKRVATRKNGARRE
jgi:hypothetical protein